MKSVFGDIKSDFKVPKTTNSCHMATPNPKFTIFLAVAISQVEKQIPLKLAAI